MTKEEIREFIFNTKVKDLDFSRACEEYFDTFRFDNEGVLLQDVIDNELANLTVYEAVKEICNDSKYDWDHYEVSIFVCFCMADREGSLFSDISYILGVPISKILLEIASWTKE